MCLFKLQEKVISWKKSQNMNKVLCCKNVRACSVFHVNAAQQNICQINSCHAVCLCPHTQVNYYDPIKPAGIVRVNWGRRTTRIQKWGRKYRDPSLLCVSVVMQVVLAALLKTRGRTQKHPSVIPTLSWRGWSWGWSSWHRYKILQDFPSDMHQEQQQDIYIYGTIITHIYFTGLRPFTFGYIFTLTGTLTCRLIRCPWCVSHRVTLITLLATRRPFLQHFPQPQFTLLTEI